MWGDDNMFKGLFNLIVILLICVVALGISPGLSPIFHEYDSTSSIWNNSLSVSLSSDLEGEYHYNPEIVSIKHQSNGKAKLDFDAEHLLKAYIYKDGELYKEEYLSKLDKSPFTLNLTKDVSHTVSIDISQSYFSLPNGSYDLIIESTTNSSSFDINPIELQVEYFKELEYIPAIRNIPNGKMALTLYYPDKDYKIQELIGITRILDYNTRPVTTIMEELKKESLSSTGLSLEPTIGEYNYVKIDKNLLYIDLPSKESIYTDEIRGKIAMTSLIKSMSQISSINRIRFLVDYNRRNSFFGDIDISKIIEVTHKPTAYLAYPTLHRYMLVEYDLEHSFSELSLDEKIEGMFKALKGRGDTELISTIPHNVNLVDYSIDKNVLNLVLSKDVVDSFDGKESLQRMMIDSIVLSFTTIDKISAVKFSIEDNQSEVIGIIDISKPFTRPMFINPETNQ